MTSFSVGAMVIAIGKNRYPHGVVCKISEEMVKGVMYRCVIGRDILDDDIGARTIGPFMASELKPVKSKRSPRKREKTLPPPVEEKEVEAPARKIMSSKKRRQSQAKGFFV